MISYIKCHSSDLGSAQRLKKDDMDLLHKFLNRTDFTDYDDFAKNVKFSVPENFNFGYDVVDDTLVSPPKSAPSCGATPPARKRS